MAEPFESEQPGTSPPGEEKVVMHLSNGRLLKGSLIRFDPAGPSVKILLSPGSDRMEVSLDEVKAIFHVKSFAGNKGYREKRKFGLGSALGRRVMVRFKDGEILVGRTDRALPESSGSLAALLSGGNKGFDILPADPESNNSKVFVVATALVDVRFL